MLSLALAAMQQSGAQGQSQNTRGFDDTVTTAGTVHNGDYYAFVIGIDDYPAPMHQLKTAVNDARAVGKLLEDRYGFRVEYLLNGDATRYNILSSLHKFRKTLRQDDNLLIYYGGHGYYDRDTRRAYWLPVDADSGTSPNTIMADDITSVTRALPPRHVLIVSDSCYSGGLSRSANEPTRTGGSAALLERELSSRSRTLMASGGLEPVADSGENGHSIFASAFLRGLQQARDLSFTAIDLFYASIRRQVGGGSSQLPEYSTLRDSGDDDGDFVFVRAISTESRAEPWFPVTPGALTIPQLDEVFRSQKYSEALPLFTQACDLGNGVGCNGLAIMYSNGWGVEKDLSRAAGLYKRACDSSHMQGCFNLAEMYESGTGVTKDLGRASGLYFQSCDGGIPTACEYLKRLNAQTKPKPTTSAASAGLTPAEFRSKGMELYKSGNYAGALPLLMRACEGGDMAVCSKLGVMYSNGEGVEKDEAQAVNLFRKACDGGELEACDNLGHYFEEYEPGMDVAKDPVQAEGLYRKACDGGNVRGCFSLGMFYLSGGTGLAIDVPQAATALRMACDGGEMRACNNLGLLYEHGTGIPKGVPKDPEQARRLYMKACDEKVDEGCKNLKRLQP